MYIHIGNARIVFCNEIVGIFNINLRQNTTNKQFIEAALPNIFLGSGDFEQFKTFIVTSDNVYLSSIASATLARRGYINI
ncbi:MAG: DUF370 domain-containing protein [Dethiobacter sp.]|jgi:hypothetical protein|nr:DUF370 domain-containing protein [Dethiobacter sp.]